MARSMSDKNAMRIFALDRRPHEKPLKRLGNVLQQQPVSYALKDFSDPSSFLANLPHVPFWNSSAV